MEYRSKIVCTNKVLNVKLKCKKLAHRMLNWSAKRSHTELDMEVRAARYSRPV